MSKLATAFALVALLAAPAALAAPTPVTVSDNSLVVEHVSYADLDVRAPAGARVLMNRIARAATRVCGRWPDSLMTDDTIRFDRCRADAYGRAVAQLDPQIIVAVSEYPPESAQLAAR